MFKIKFTEFIKSMNKDIDFEKVEKMEFKKKRNAENYITERFGSGIFPNLKIEDTEDVITCQKKAQ
jgi:hypothetical protein